MTLIQYLVVLFNKYINQYGTCFMDNHILGMLYGVGMCSLEVDMQIIILK